jgi:hypothetical protein
MFAVTTGSSTCSVVAGGCIDGHSCCCM